MDYNDVNITISKVRYEHLLKKEEKCNSLPKLYITIELQTALNKFYYHCDDREFDEHFSYICSKNLIVLNKKLEEIKKLCNKVPWWKKII
jgi:hypothetical protein